jgi:tetratricopeptide (TPR) repeat protein
MRRLLSLAFMLFVASAPARAQDQAERDFQRLFVRALELQKAGDVLGAIDTYKAALTLVPGQPDALSNLGAAYVRLGQYDDAIAQYETALKNDSTNATVRLNLALAYYKSARPSEAIAHLKRVVASDPEAKGAYLVLADCYLQTGQDQEVISLLKPREQMFPGDMAYAFLLGTALLHLDNVAEGQIYVDRVFGGGESAEAHLEAAIKLNPKLPTVHALHGRTLRSLGDPDAAERAFRRELDLNVNDFDANLHMGNLRKDAQRFAEASTYLERAVTIRPANVNARRLLATVRLQTGRNEEAVELLEAIVKEVPDLVEAHVQLATAYNRLQRKEEAERERSIIDRLNAEAQKKQAGSTPPKERP